MSLIRSKPSSKEYRDNWERAFRAREKYEPTWENMRVDEPLPEQDPEDITEQLGAIRVKECKDIEPEGGGSIRG